MIARVSTYGGTPDRVEDAVRAFESVTDPLRNLDGFQGAYMLIDKATGRAMTMTLWGTEEAERASAEAANQMRSQAAGSAGASVESVTTYEVALHITP